jgi:hypothetical protein
MRPTRPAAPTTSRPFWCRFPERLAKPLS